ncbi:TPA: hypothetical protein U0919_000670 [Streptococcus suis]|nr:hypothetical protein [Streptococcus suis]HEM3623663.1 hypothetical protein [Streptococcus suis]
MFDVEHLPNTYQNFFLVQLVEVLILVISEKNALKRMGFESLKIFCEKIGVEQSKVKYFKELGWFIINNFQPNIPDESTYSGWYNGIDNVYQKQEQEKASEIVAILEANQRPEIRKRKKLNPKTPLEVDSASFRVGHLLAHSILNYICFEDGPDKNDFHRYNLFYETREANEFTKKGFNQEVIPQRILEIIIQNAIGEIDFSRDDGKGAPEKKRLRKFFKLLRSRQLISDKSYDYYHLPENNKLIFYVKLIYGKSDDIIPSAINLQSKSDDNKLYFNVVIPNIEDTKFNFLNGQDIS